jgi:hypothetical protein
MATEIAQYTGPVHRFSVPEIWDMAKAVAASRLFKDVTTPEAAYTLMLLCEAEDIHPIQAVRRFHIIQGRPSMRADAMLAEFQRHGGWVRWGVVTSVTASAVFGHKTHCPDGMPLSVKIEDFKHLAKKDVWINHPDDMLVARLISKAVRRIDPAVIVGLYTPDEALEAADANGEIHHYNGGAIDVTPKAAPVPTQGPPDDFPVIGQEGEGHDPRPYLDVAKSAIKAVNAKIEELAKDADFEGMTPLAVNLIHGAVYRAAVEAKHVEKPADGTPALKAGQVIKVITEMLYPFQRAFVRETIQATLLGQLAEIERTINRSDAEDVELEPVGAQEEPGANG